MDTLKTTVRKVEEDDAERAEAESELRLLSDICGISTVASRSR